jgi:uncharacterized protein YbjT (DUF2867 family)
MYVITGATGNTGSVVANQLLAKSQPTRIPPRLRRAAFGAQA